MVQLLLPDATLSLGTLSCFRKRMASGKRLWIPSLCLLVGCWCEEAGKGWKGMSFGISQNNHGMNESKNTASYLNAKFLSATEEMYFQNPGTEQRTDVDWTGRCKYHNKLCDWLKRELGISFLFPAVALTRQTMKNSHPLSSPACKVGMIMPVFLCRVF